MVKKTKRADYGSTFALPVGTAVFTQFINKINSSQGEFPSNKYEILVAWPKGTDFTNVKAHMLEVGKSKFGDDFTLGELDHMPLNSGNEKMDVDKYPIFKDAIYATLKRREKSGPPPIYDYYTKEGKLQPLDATKIYAGCKVQLFGTVGCSKIDGKKSCWIDLDAIQFVADGDRLGGNSKAELDSLITANSSAEAIANVLEEVTKEPEIAPINVVAAKAVKANKPKVSLLDSI